MTALVLVRVRPFPVLAETGPERFWIGGRYDGNRAVVYFDAVKLGRTIPPNVIKIAYPVADAFFNPVELPASYVAGLQKGPNAERFSLGDRYDLLLGGDEVATMTLTTLVGFAGDEQVGNDSFIGALCTLDREDGLLFKKDYYAVRRHGAAGSSGGGTRSSQAGLHTGLIKEPVPFDIQVQVASLLSDRRKTLAINPVRSQAGKVGPAFHIQPFTLADGSVRYYVRAEWKANEGIKGDSTFALGTWMARQPALHILATERQTSKYGFDDELPILCNVVDLGARKSGIIVSLAGYPSHAHVAIYRSRRVIDN